MEFADLVVSDSAQTKSPGWPKPRKLRLALVGLGLVAALGVTLFFINRRTVSPDQPVEVPRVFREVESFHRRVQEGLDYLCNERGADQALVANDVVPQLIGIADDSRSPSIFRREFRWTLPRDVLPAEDLAVFCNVVLAGWPVLDAYPGHSGGGGGERFELSFEDSRSYAGMLLTAFEEDGITRIHSQKTAVVFPTLDPPSAEEADGERRAIAESLDGFRVCFTAELRRRCAPYAAATQNPREKNRYSFNSGGSGSGGPTGWENGWRWVVPRGVLEPEGLCQFAEDLGYQWRAAKPSVVGKEHSYSLAFGSGTHQAFLNIIAIPASRSGTARPPETVIYYHQFLFRGAPGSDEPTVGCPAEEVPINRELLSKVPGSMKKERLANAKLDGDGRMLKSLRERDRQYTGTWKIEYNIFSPTPVPEEIVESFAASLGMAWEVNRRYLRFFKVMEFSESEIEHTTSAVRQFAGEHGGRYIGWNFKSDKIKTRPGWSKEGALPFH